MPGDDTGACVRELYRTPTPPQAPECGIRFHSRKPVSKLAAPGLVRAHWVETKKPSEADRTKSDHSWRFGADFRFIKIIGMRLFLNIARYLSFLLE